MRPQTTAAEAQPDIAAWLDTRAIRLRSIVPGQGFDDLQPLRDMFAGVRLVGLGEATHGTREFFQCKHRLFEFLVRELGFTVFAIEASYSACQTINDYVLYGQGDPATALASQRFWTWDTEEVAELVRWMREYNQTQPAASKVRFYGYDVQVVERSLAIVRAYLERVAPEFVAAAESGLTAVAETHARSRKPTAVSDPQGKARSLSRLRQLIGYLSAHRVRLIRSSSDQEFTDALQHARVCLQLQESYGRPAAMTNETSILRDLYMAENIEYIARNLEPSARIAVWAHNAHIFTGTYMPGVVSMGAHLRRIFGTAYYALGFTFNAGSFQSRELLAEAPDLKVGPLREFAVGPVGEGTLERQFVDAGLPDSIVDFRAGPEHGPVGEWLRTKKPMRTYDEVYSPEWPPLRSLCQTAPRDYDGLIYIPLTTRSRPNPTGVR